MIDDPFIYPYTSPYDLLENDDYEYNQIPVQLMDDVEAEYLTDPYLD